MKCKHCKYFSPRGRHVNGEFIQNTNGEGIKLGWCQHSPPTNGNNWPVVSEKEKCGCYEEEPTPRYYVELYNEYRDKYYTLESKTRNYDKLCDAIRDLGRLVGRRKSAGLFNTIKAVRESLTKAK